SAPCLPAASRSRYMTVPGLMSSCFSGSSAHHRGCCACLSLSVAAQGNGRFVKLQLQTSNSLVEHLFFSTSSNVRSCMRAGNTKLRQDCFAPIQVTVLLTKLAGSNDLGFETGNREFS